MSELYITAKKASGLASRLVRPLREHARVPEYSFTLTEHDPQRPWIVVGQQHSTVALMDLTRFREWAAERWPEPRWTVELDPWQDGQEWPGTGSTAA